MNIVLNIFNVTNTKKGHQRSYSIFSVHLGERMKWGEREGNGNASPNSTARRHGDGITSLMIVVIKSDSPDLLRLLPDSQHARLLPSISLFNTLHTKYSCITRNYSTIVTLLMITNGILMLWGLIHAISITSAIQYNAMIMMHLIGRMTITTRHHISTPDKISV